MNKIIFEDLPSQNSPINAKNLNQVQDNVETALGTKSNIGTSLYKNEEGTAEAITLNETSANFDRLRILYKDVYGVYGSVDVCNPDGKSVDMISLRNGSQAIVILNSIISISGDSITWDSSYRYSLATSEYFEETTIYITEVIGYKD